MTNADRPALACIARRDFMIAGAGATTLAAGLAAAGTPLAQAGAAPATPPGPAKPGNILVEQRGSEGTAVDAEAKVTADTVEHGRA